MAIETIKGEVDTKATKYNVMDESNDNGDGIYSFIKPPLAAGGDTLTAILSLTSAENSDIVHAQINVLGSSQGGSEGAEQMLLALAVLSRTMHNELTAKLLKMRHSLGVVEDNLKCARVKQHDAEKACGMANKAYKAMKQEHKALRVDHRVLQRQLRGRSTGAADIPLRQQGRSADATDVHVEGESADENDDVTMTSTSQDDILED